ncbi:MAG: carboxypeptidase-like regulatory domain-containing protein [Planctomycetota bacterium]
MKPNSRISMLACLAIGLLLIAYGLLQSGAGGRTDGSSGPGRVTVDGPEDRPARLSDVGEHGSRAASDLVTPGALPPASPKDASETSVEVSVTFLRDGSPAPEARIGLWRVSTGEGPSYRPARKLTELFTDDSGQVLFSAPQGVPLEIYGRALVTRANDTPQPQLGKIVSGPVAKQPISPLSSGEHRRVNLVVERPPDPLQFVVLDRESSEPVSGAAIRSITLAGQNRGLEDFPGTTQLEGRTDGKGISSLRGPVRKLRWLIVDAAGYAPQALRPSSFDGVASAEIRMSAAGRVEMVVLGQDGQPASGITVRLIASLGEFRTSYTGATDPRGEVSFRGLPVGLPLVTEAETPEGDVQPFSALTLEPGEERGVRIALR